MAKPRKQKEHKPLPSVKGVMTCERGHRWNVVDLNQEIKVVKCPVCGGLTSIANGLEK